MFSLMASDIEKIELLKGGAIVALCFRQDDKTVIRGKYVFTKGDGTIAKITYKDGRVESVAQ
jgi:hypothetical protein